MTRDTTAPWVTAAAKLGVPSVIALVLIWWLTSVVSASLRDIQSTLGEHVSTSNFYLHAICVNAAHSEAERSNCIPPSPSMGHP